MRITFPSPVCKCGSLILRVERQKISKSKISCSRCYGDAESMRPALDDFCRQCVESLASQTTGRVQLPEELSGRITLEHHEYPWNKPNDEHPQSNPS